MGQYALGKPKVRFFAEQFFPINARSETVEEKPIFREAYLENRCLIPADGWFEWQLIEGQKYPHHIYSKIAKHSLLPVFGKLLIKRKYFPSLPAVPPPTFYTSIIVPL